MWRLSLLLPIFFSGCTVIATVLFRNYSNNTVRIQASLIDRNYFEKLPNKVHFYDTSKKKKQFYGDWKKSELVTWVDTATFYIDVPAFTVIDVADVSGGLSWGGAKQPNVLLLMISPYKVDTLMTGDYTSFIKKFKSNGLPLFKNPVFYYDIH